MVFGMPVVILGGSKIRKNISKEKDMFFKSQFDNNERLQFYVDVV